MIVEQTNRRWWFTLNGAVRQAMLHGMPGFGPPKIVLTEYPKSGGTWVSQMIAEYLGILYARNRLPSRQRCLIHGHYLHVADANDIIVIWRDGRDVMVSYYYEILFAGPMKLAGQADAYRKRLGIGDASDIGRYLPRFIEHCFTQGLPRGSWVRFDKITWARFADIWKSRTGYAETSYEAMSENPQRELRQILQTLGVAEIADERLAACVETFSFENVTGRQRGEENLHDFARKGIVGDWKNVFTREARQVFDHYAGQALIDLGYETDRSWVD